MDAVSIEVLTAQPAAPLQLANQVLPSVGLCVAPHVRECGTKPPPYQHNGDRFVPPPSRSVGLSRTSLASRGRMSEPPLHAEHEVSSAVPSLRALRRAAAPDLFARGEEYFAQERVRGLVVDPGGAAAATVRGSADYRVRLSLERGALSATCTCPFAADRGFCKHAVAAALTWRERSHGGEISAREGASRDRGDELQTILAAHPKGDLVNMLLEIANEDDALRDRLLLRASREGAFDIATYKRAIRHAVATGGGIPYREATDYANRVEEVVRAVAELARRGHAAETIELAEYFLAALERRIGDVDDSDGLIGGIVEQLCDLHLAGCRKAQPDPVRLARRLFHWELTSENGVFAGAVTRYAGVLGKDGVAAYRAAAEEEWMKVRRLGPGDDTKERYGERFRITEVMKALARHDHDVDALVAVLARDLSSSYSFVEIAQVLQEAAEHDRALEWAERGVAAFPEADPRLRDLLAEEYARGARHDDALRVMWAEFSERPYLEAYQKLKRRADRTGSWPDWRAKALALVRERIDGSRRSGRGARWHHRTDHSGLVRLLLWESNFEAAWHEAQQGGCSGDLWRELAQRREREHPEDALAVYRSLIEPALAPKNDAAYAEATALLRKMRDLLQRAGHRGEFADELVAVRAAHRRKRNFMRMLDVLE